jgi:flagellar basal-body rod protein FlgB
MQPYSSAVMVKVIEGLSARMTVTAENIANASTPGYRALRVSFEDALTDAARVSDAAVAAVKPRITQAPRDVEGVRIDQELMTDSATAMRYSAVVGLLSREFQLQSLAVTGGQS